MSGLCIRKATEDDFDAIFKLAKELCEFVKLDYEPRLLEERLKVALKTNNVASYLVAVSSEKVVGYCMYYFIYCSWAGKGAFLEELSVDSSYRGSGIGTALLRQCYENTEANNANRIEFVCSDWNVKAVDFYKRFGAVNLTSTTSANVFCIDFSNFNKTD